MGKQKLYAQRAFGGWEAFIDTEDGKHYWQFSTWSDVLRFATRHDLEALDITNPS